jgi:uncharacterized protein (DUF849 family)
MVEDRRRAVLLKACLNGSRSRAEHEAVPMSPPEIAAEAQRAVAAGAGALHVHPRRADGTETLDPVACGDTIRAVRAACPGVPVGLSTGVWIEGDPAARIAHVSRWVRLPDFVSVNFSEPGTVELCELLVARRIGIEAGLWSAAEAEALVRSGLAGRCLRILIEPREHEAGAAIATGNAIAAVLDRHDIRIPRLLHGEGHPAWPVLEAALARGCDLRIGFEDTLVLPDGSRAPDNGSLVAAAVRILGRHGHRPAPARAR